MIEQKPDEHLLARRAAAGDGDAFAVLYERYEQRTYNLCLRIVASEADAADATQEAFLSVLRRLPQLQDQDLAFGSYVFTSARNACYDLLQRRRRTEPSDEIAEGATPVGSATGGGGIGFDPGDPDDDPERNVLQQARTEEIAAANASLPERQREVLALKELEGLSYDEIAEIMGMNRNSVAQLISRARINLRDALRGTALASIAASSADCERALPLIASREDRQLDPGDDAWLSAHLSGCETCALAIEAMAEAGVSYRAWVPVAAAPFLLRETIAKAAELTGSDWTDVIERAERRRGGRGGGRLAGLVSHPRVDLALATAATVLLLLVVLVGSAGDAGQSERLAPLMEETATTVPATTTSTAPAAKAERKRSAKKKDEPAAATTPEQAASETADPEPVPAGDAADPVADEPAAAQPRQRRRAQTVGGDEGSRTEGGLDGGEQPAATTPTTDPPPQPEQPTTTTPPPEQPPEEPPAQPCGLTPSNPCPQPPRPPRICRDPATGAQIPCGLRTP